MLKAYFLKEDSLWFAFWRLVDCRWAGCLYEVPACRGSMLETIKLGLLCVGKLMIGGVRAWGG